MLHCPFILAQKHLGQRTKNQIAERQPMQAAPIGGKINATLHIGNRCGHQPIRKPYTATLHQFHSLVRQ